MLKMFIATFCQSVQTAMDAYEQDLDLCKAGFICFGPSNDDEYVCQFLKNDHGNPSAQPLFDGKCLADTFEFIQLNAEGNIANIVCSNLIPQLAFRLRQYDQANSQVIGQLIAALEQSACDGILEASIQTDEVES